MAAAPVRYAFDLDLGRRNERGAMLSETAMAALIESARAEGFQEGIRESQRSAARVLAEAAERLANRVAADAAMLNSSRHATLAEAVSLSAIIARKLAGHLLACQPVAEIDALLVECLASIDGAPHLVIRCHPDLAEAIREIATARIELSGFAGRLVVLGDPDIAMGDGRIEWVDGGLVRDRSAIDAEIDARIAAYLTAERNSGGTTP
jgi:flagellar assembly protein FliH